jgi:hypothetical protein
MPYKRTIILPLISRNISGVVSLIVVNVLMGRGMGLTGMPITIALLASGGLKPTWVKPFRYSNHRNKRGKGRGLGRSIIYKKAFYKIYKKAFCRK